MTKSSLTDDEFEELAEDNEAQSRYDENGYARNLAEGNKKDEINW